MTPALIAVGDERLEVLRIAPERAGPTIVFLHEGLGSVTGWRDFPRTLTDRLGAPALVYSRRGYGRSERLPVGQGRLRAIDYLHRESWIVLPALLDALAITAPFLVGHSDGGSIALLYAARYQPRAIAIMAPHVFVEDISIEGILEARRAWYEGRLSAPLARFHDDPEGAFRGWNDTWLDPEFRSWNIEAELPRIRCPVLAIQGYQDRVRNDGTTRPYRTRLSSPCRQLRLDNCGHTPQRDQPAAVIDAIATVYRELEFSTP